MNDWNWKSVKDEYPPPWTRVLVAYPDGMTHMRVDIASLKMDDAGARWIDGRGMAVPKPSHWAYLPPPPAPDEESEWRDDPC